MIINNLFKNSGVRALLLFGFLFSGFVFGGNSAKALPAPSCGDVDYGGENLRIETNTTLCGTISNVNNFIVNPGVTLSVLFYDSDNPGSGMLTINAQSAQIYGTINASGMGYPGGAAQQNGVGAPSTSGEGIYVDSESGIGGTAYGSVTTPNEMGSGGSGSYNNAGGAGGGYIGLNIANTLTVSGSITANGGNGGTGAGGGAGGGIYISASTIAGSGSITANGGNGGSNGTAYSGGGAYGGDGGIGAPGYGSGGAGGGGRIAIYYTTDSFTGTIQAYGGDGYQAGGAGTIYKKSSARNFNC
jgi:hypothetical protein